MSKAATLYLKKVNKQLKCPDSLKKDFMSQLEAEVLFYCDDHSDASEDQLRKQFGSPDDVAQEFLSEVGIRAVKQYNNSQRNLWSLIAGILFVVILFASVLGVRTQLLKQQLPNEEIVAAIIYETESDGFSWFPLQDFIFGSKEN